MDIAMYLASPVLETITIIAFLAMIAAPIWYFTEKTQTGQRFMTWIETMGMTPEQIEEDPYNGFRIHSTNYQSKCSC